MEKSKKIAGVVLFVAIAVMLMIPISYMLRPATGGNEEHRKRMTGFYAEPEDSLNIVTLGSSAVFRYVDNPLLWKEHQITSYNFSSPSQSIFALEYMIEEVEKTQSPDLYIVDARQFILNGSKEQNDVKTRQLVDNMKYSRTRCAIINKMIPKWSDRLSYYFDFIIYHGDWENLSMDSLEYADNERIHEMKSWVVVNVIKEVEKQMDPSGEGELPIHKDAEEELRYLLDKWEKENVNVLFLCTPWAVDEESQKQSNYMRRIVEEAGFHYLDCNLYQEELNLDYSRDFYNNRHVNAAGAEKTTALLGDYIEEHFTIKKKEDKAIIKEWKTTEKLYDEKMAAFMKRYNKAAKDEGEIK